MHHARAGPSRRRLGGSRVSRTFLVPIAAAAMLCCGGRSAASPAAAERHSGYPFPPAECSVYVGYDRDAVLPGYRMPGTGGAPMCVPFATTAAHPPPGYRGDFYVSEFTDAKLRERWQACHADPTCLKRVETHIERRLPPNVDRKIRAAHARYLLGAVDQDEDGLPLSKIRRPAFFGPGARTSPGRSLAPIRSRSAPGAVPTIAWSCT